MWAPKELREFKIIQDDLRVGDSSWEYNEFWSGIVTNPVAAI